MSRPKKRPAVWPRVPSFICFTVAHIAFELVLYRHKRAWKPALWSRVGTRRHGVIGVRSTAHDSNDSSQPARFSGRAAIFLSIYLRKRNTTVLDAAHRAVFLLPRYLSRTPTDLSIERSWTRVCCAGDAAAVPAVPSFRSPSGRLTAYLSTRRSQAVLAAM